MSLPTNLPQAVLQTILTRLAALFLAGANGDTAAARQAAAQMLAAYHPQTEDELFQAAGIVCFGFQSLEALSQAATPDMPLTRILRLRGSAVTLSRESDKARRRLDQLQKLRRQGAAAEAQPEPALPAPTALPEPALPKPKASAEAKIERAVDLIHDTAQVAEAAQASGLTWNQSHEKRQQDQRIAASLKRAEARVAAYAAATTPGAQPGHQNPIPAFPAA